MGKTIAAWFIEEIVYSPFDILIEEGAWNKITKFPIKSVGPKWSTMTLKIMTNACKVTFGRTNSQGIQKSLFPDWPEIRSILILTWDSYAVVFHQTFSSKK